MQSAFKWLAKFRGLRGTALDVFGYTAERKQERQDVTDYRDLLASLVTGLNADNYAVAAQLAASVARLRGYGHVKDRNREQVREEQDLLLRRFRGEEAAVPVRFVNAA